VDGVAFLEPVPALGPGRDSPVSRLAERVCLIGPTPAGFRLLSDVTTSPHGAWRAGGVSRMMSSLCRAVRRAGESAVFEPNGPEAWAQVRRRLESLLGEWWDRGALGGRSSAEAFRVRCDRGTMTQADLDQGRIRAEVGVLPARAVERITVVLALQNGAVQLTAPEVAS
jgi:phage tail sheath protein FI